MRTSLGDHLVTLRRPAALAALAAAAGGVVAVLSPRLGLYELVAEVQALDTIGAQRVTVLAGADATAVTWGVAGVGVVVVALALLVAVDRPPGFAEPTLVACGALLLAAVVWLLVDAPADQAFADRPGVADLVAPGTRLPTGVDLQLAVRPAAGVWLLAGAGVLVIAGTLVALRRG